MEKQWPATFAGVLAFVLAAVLTGCGGAGAPKESVSPPRPAPPVDLLALVPEGASIIVHVRPETLTEFGDLHGVVDLVLTPRAKKLFETRYGIPLMDVDEIVVAHYDESELVLVREVGKADAIVRTAAKQLFLERKSDTPFLRRGGFVGNEPRELASIHPDVAAVCTGDLTPLFAVVQRVKDPRGAPSDRDSASAATRDTVLAVFAPRPLGLPQDAPVGLLLAREDSLSAILREKSPGVLELTVTLHGEFPPGAEANFRALVAGLASEPWLSALGIERYRDTLQVRTWEQGIQLRGEVRVAELQAGLRTVFVTEIAELVAHLGSD